MSKPSFPFTWGQVYLPLFLPAKPPRLSSLAVLSAIYLCPSFMPLKKPCRLVGLACSLTMWLDKAGFPTILLSTSIHSQSEHTTASSLLHHKLSIVYALSPVTGGFSQVHFSSLNLFQVVVVVEESELVAVNLAVNLASLPKFTFCDF